MKIGITGASGFIGSNFGRLAAQRGHQVVAFSRSGRAGHPWAAEGRVLTSTAHGNVGSSPGIDASGCDALVHLAGESLLGYWTPRKKEVIWKSRIDLTQAVVRSLERLNPRPSVLLCASGAGFYGDRGDELLDESSSRGSGFLSDLCEEWEVAARDAERLGLRVVCLRAGMVFGSDGGAFPLLKRVFRLGLGGRLGTGRQWQPWIHAEDQTRMMLWCIENPAVTGPVNQASPSPVTNRELTATLARCLKRPAFLHVPAMALRLALRAMADEMLLASQRMIPRAAHDLGFEFRHPGLEAAFSHLLSR